MTNILTKIGLVTLGAILAVASYGLIATTQASAMGKPGANNGTIVDVATAKGFTSLAAALECAGLVEVFDGNRQFTVFAPTNEAFATALSDLGLTFEQLCNDKATLTNILKYHVTPGVKTSKNVLNRTSMNMLNGDRAARVGGTIGGAELSSMLNIRATNGVIHVVNDVMLP